MNVIGLDGNTYSWKITRYNKKSEFCSSFHLRARLLLVELFPYDKIYEEVVIPGIKNETNIKSLTADFYIHTPRLMIEVQGEQHYKYVPFFHNNKLQFLKAKKLDKLKEKWCLINNIRLIELKYNQTDEEWASIIKG
jgi:hypothetical protein